MPQVRLSCPSCDKEKTWATYVHSPCPRPRDDSDASEGGKPLGGATGTTTWSQEAMGATPDGVPHRQPCPGCQTYVDASHVKCRDCGYIW